MQVAGIQQTGSLHAAGRQPAAVGTELDRVDREAVRKQRLIVYELIDRQFAAVGDSQPAAIL